VEVVTCYQYLIREYKEFVLSKQLLRSGTSVGANITEAQDAQSKKDFISKMSIALKEAKETRYWLDLLEECGYINKSITITTYKKRSFKLGELFLHIQELIKMLSSIVKTSKQGL
jgi:four helix bundle protein